MYMSWTLLELRIEQENIKIKKQYAAKKVRDQDSKTFQYRKDDLNQSKP